MVIGDELHCENALGIMSDLNFQDPPPAAIAVLCWVVPGLYLASLRHRLTTAGWPQKILLTTLALLSIVGMWGAYKHAFSPRSLITAIACLAPAIHFGLIEAAVRSFARVAGREPDIAFLGRGPMADRFFSVGVLAICVTTLVPLALLLRNDA